MPLRDQYGRWVNNVTLYPLLGLRDGNHLPDEGFPVRDVQGVWFKCEPANKIVGQKSSKYRIKTLCVDCDRWLPYGRWSQHIKGKEHRLNREIRYGNP